MAIIAGYTGIYRQPYAPNDLYGDTIYAITTDQHQDLTLILLTPGCYKDAFQIAAQVSYQAITIFAPSCDDLWISDIFRLVIDLKKIKKSVRWFYPTQTTVSPTNMLFQTSGHISNFVLNEETPGVSVEYVLANTEPGAHPFYDIYVVNDQLKMAFSLYMTEEKLKMLIDKHKMDEVHLPYNVRFYGGITGKEAAVLDQRKYANRLVANNFKCREEFIECTTSHLILPGKRA